MQIEGKLQRTLQQRASVVHRFVRHHFVRGTDTPGASKSVQMLDVTAAVVPHLGQIYRKEVLEGGEGGGGGGRKMESGTGGTEVGQPGQKEKEESILRTKKKKTARRSFCIALHAKLAWKPPAAISYLNVFI